MGCGGCCVALRWLFRWLRCVGGSVALVNFVGCVALVVALRWLPSGMLRMRSIAQAQPQTTGQPADLNDHAGLQSQTRPAQSAFLSCTSGRQPRSSQSSSSTSGAHSHGDARDSGVRIMPRARYMLRYAPRLLAQPAAAVLPDSRLARWLRPLAPLLVGRHGSVRFH